MRVREVPEPKLIMLGGAKEAVPTEAVDIRELRFLQSRSLATKSEIAICLSSNKILKMIT